jgi:hypothetical protein
MSSDSEVDSDELDPDEPRTPLWLTLLGGGLFLLALLLFLLTRTDTEAETGTDVAEAPGTNTEEGAEAPGAQPEGDTEDHTDHGHEPLARVTPPIQTHPPPTRGRSSAGRAHDWQS